MFMFREKKKQNQYNYEKKQKSERASMFLRACVFNFRYMCMFV